MVIQDKLIVIKSCFISLFSYILWYECCQFNPGKVDIELQVVQITFRVLGLLSSLNWSKGQFGSVVKNCSAVRKSSG